MNVRKYQTNGIFTGTNSSSSSNFQAIRSTSKHLISLYFSVLCLLDRAVGEFEDVREVLPVRFHAISSHSSAYYFLDISPSSSFCVLFRFIIVKCSLSDAIHDDPPFFTSIHTKYLVFFINFHCLFVSLSVMLFFLNLSVFILFNARDLCNEKHKH